MAEEERSWFEEPATKPTKHTKPEPTPIHDAVVTDAEQDGAK